MGKRERGREREKWSNSEGGREGGKERVLERERVEIPCIMIDETRERETYPDCMSDHASTCSSSIRTSSTATAWDSGRPVEGAVPAFLARTPGWARAPSGHGKEGGRGHGVPVLDAGDLVERVVRLIYTTCVKMLPFTCCNFRCNFRLWTGERTFYKWSTCS